MGVEGEHAQSVTIKPWSEVTYILNKWLQDGTLLWFSLILWGSMCFCASKPCPCSHVLRGCTENRIEA